MASRFAQTLLKKLLDCINTNPVKMAFSIAKVIIEIKDVGCCLCILYTWALHRLTIIRRSETTKTSLRNISKKRKTLLAVERAVVSGAPKAAEEAMENPKSYIVFRAPKGYHKEHITIQDPWERNEGIEEPCR